MSSFLEEISQLLGKVGPEERQIIAAQALLKTQDRVWVPNPGGPQIQAAECEADELFYGGQAGGGKTDLSIGLAFTKHKRSLILRRINKDAVKLVERAAEIVGHREGYNGQLQRWRYGERLVEFSGCEREGDKQRYKGDPHDFIAFDEGTDFLYSQYRFIIGWNRSADPRQRCRVIVGSNPPTTAEGLWVIKHWSPWLDPSHPNPAKPGELRWYTTGEDGSDLEVDGPGPHMISGEMVRARSRTYIPAKLSDNPDLAADGRYAGVLAGLPEELRQAYRDGNFSIGLQDDPNQVIPTAWIEAAQARWTPVAPQGIGMTAMGVDIAQGGAAQTILAARYNGWYAPLITRPGKATQSGREVAALIIGHRFNACPVVVDCGGGWGSETIGVLGENGITAVSYLGNRPTLEKSRDGKLSFCNKRAATWWRFREELNPEQEGGSAVALPPGATIKADLASPRWTLTTRGILIEEKAEIMKRLGRSPDEGDAIVLAMHDGAKAVAAAIRFSQQGAERPRTMDVGFQDAKNKIMGRR